MTRTKARKKAKQSNDTLPLPIVSEKDQRDFMFSLNMNLVPYPHRPLGRKSLPVVFDRSQLVSGALYWVRNWEGGNGAGNWALCKFVERLSDRMKFQLLASTSDWTADLPDGIVYMLNRAIERKQIRLAQNWTPLEHADILNRSVTKVDDTTHSVDLDITEAAR